ncbi:MAG: YqgE/AlgH family protein, partial [Gemmataceae bacterium]|jgi:putative transcriptional regulator|nr:YqgE/AlgH family protein [Gemmataceae bacterium]MBJ7498047.1 YqgE/AlgH family protein [Gemmataceae bacterium]MCY2970963.1 YqgE/AlgH family protein [Planctomycetota bacterium]
MSYASQFIIARPSLQDPNFQQTVILLLQHDPSGAFGLVVNRPLPPQAWTLPFPLYLGGPCKSEGLLMLHGHQEWMDLQSQKEKQIVPGVFIGDEECVKQATQQHAEEATGRFLMMTGYAGWGPGQLESEISQGAWALVKATSENLFEINAEDKWASLLPSIIPQPSDN